MAGSPFEPLRHPGYRRLWLGALCLNLGLWMQVVTAGWLMVSLGGTPLEVGLIQTASALPAFLFAVPGGVIADLVERRRYLLLSQGALALVAVMTTALAFTGCIGPTGLLVLTFAYGLGYAVQGPAWFTAQQDVLPAASRLAALSLGAVSYSSARAIGPALAGGLMLASSPPVVFACVGALALVSVALLARVLPMPPHRAPGAVAESFLAATATTLRYARHDAPVQQQLLRTLLFIVPGAALWALLPLVAQGGAAPAAGSSAAQYGLLLGSLGLGAVIGGLSLTAVHARLGSRTVEVAGTLLFLMATVAGAITTTPWLLLPLCVAGGAGWAWVGTLGVTALQLQAAPHLRARALGLYLIAFQGAMAAGGALWGQLTGGVGLRAALAVAAGGLVVSVVVSGRLPWPANWHGSEAPPH
ncbi:MAG: MFS transporter [Rubrivivax sp.]|nr:MFS transporter [Rubrivivax sp.]